MDPYLVTISGVMGTGKTTLAKNLARALSWTYLPESSRGTAFLPDLFRDQARWAFNAQIAFLVDKAVQLQRSFQQRHHVVLDRSLYEDVLIFARYFFKVGAIDRRSYDTYRALADHLLADMKPPDLLIYCTCSIETAKTRIAARPDKPYQPVYPDGHIETIVSAYEAWIRAYDMGPVYVLDTDLIDFRKRDEFSRVLTEALRQITRDVEDPQLSLALDSESPVDTRVERPSHLVRPLARGRRSPGYPFAYLAAPFTAVASDATGSTQPPTLFTTELPHGEIARGRYRSALSRLANAIERLGINTLLPHRDVNEWGTKVLSPQTVFEACSLQVSQCDLFIGLLGESHGSHFEFGMATAMDKPRIIVRCDEIRQSFISEGIVASPNLIEYKCQSLEEIALLVKDPAVRRFMRLKLGR